MAALRHIAVCEIDKLGIRNKTDGCQIRERCARKYRLREWRMIAKGLSRKAPVLAHLIPIRRCNLPAPTEQFDDVSACADGCDAEAGGLLASSDHIITRAAVAASSPELEKIIERVA